MTSSIVSYNNPVISQNIPLLNLPLEVIVEAIQYLRVVDIKSFSCISKTFRLITAHHDFWRQLFYRVFPSINTPEMTQFQKPFIMHSHVNQNISLSHFLQGHEDLVSSLVKCQTKVVSGSYDNSIKIWDLNHPTCLATLCGHTAPVTCLAT